MGREGGEEGLGVGKHLGGRVEKGSSRSSSPPHEEVLQRPEDGLCPGKEIEE